MVEAEIPEIVYKEFLPKEEAAAPAPGAAPAGGK